MKRRLKQTGQPPIAVAKNLMDLGKKLYRFHPMIKRQKLLAPVVTATSKLSNADPSVHPAHPDSIGAKNFQDDYLKASVPPEAHLKAF